jgi:hypothetical protein
MHDQERPRSKKVTDESFDHGSLTVTYTFSMLSGKKIHHLEK